MKIGVLTFLHVANYGANLQATSTYYYLKNQGHTPVFIDYSSLYTDVMTVLSNCKRKLQHLSVSVQTLEHEKFVNENIKIQTRHVHSCSQVLDVIKEEGEACPMSSSSSLRRSSRSTSFPARCRLIRQLWSSFSSC